MEPQSFVLATPDVLRERRDSFDVYRAPDTASGDDALRPAVVFVHGGPRPPGVEWRPRDQPVFVGYGSIAAAAGVVGVVLEHHMASLAECAAAADEIAVGLDQVRQLPGVDPNRVALWFFSGSGLLAADWLKHPPAWLTCLALTYPVLQTLPEWGGRAAIRFHSRRIGFGSTADSAHTCGPRSSRIHLGGERFCRGGPRCEPRDHRRTRRTAWIRHARSHRRIA